MYLPARGEDLLTHAPYDDGELVRTDMGVSIDENLRICPEATEDPKDLLHTPPLTATSIELAVGEGSCTALSEAVVRLGIDPTCLL